MNNLSKELDTSDELFVQSWLNGVKLIPPANFNGVINSQSSAKCIKNLLQLPINVFFSLSGSTIFKLNEKTASICGFESVKSAIGRTVADVATDETFEFEKIHDLDVINSRQLIIRDELYVRRDGSIASAISFKIPWYKDNNKIIGIFGCAIVMEESNLTSLAESMMSILETKLFKYPATSNDYKKIIPGLEIDKYYLTQRQNQCAQLLIRGKSAKEIAAALKLSKRTVEHYIEDMKLRLEVHSKSELIETLLEYFQL